MRFYLYCRKSSEDRGKQIQSIEDQDNWGHQVASKHGYNIVRVFHETKSAKEPGRREFNEMMRGIENGEADGILSWKLDRLSRNPVDEGRIRWLHQSKRIKLVVTCEREYWPEDNVLMMSFGFGVANEENLVKGRSSKRGMQSKADKGWFPGVAPVGYINTGEQGLAEIHPDPERFDLVRRMWKLGLSGQYSLDRICEEAYSWGFRTRKGRKLAKSTLQNIFTNPFYCGDFLYKGELMKGKQKPMISRAEFDYMQASLGDKGRSRASKQFFAFTGFMACGQCGSAITAEKKHKKLMRAGGIRTYVYYHCSRSTRAVNCSQRSIEQKDLEAQFTSFLSTVEMPTEYVDWIIKNLHQATGEEIHDRKIMLDATQSQIEKVASKLDSLIEMRLERLLTDDEFIQRKNSLMVERAMLMEKLDEINNRQDSWIEQADRAFAYTKNIVNQFNNGDVKTKREILSTVGSNWLIMDGKVLVEAKGEYIPIQKGARLTNDILAQFEPREGLAEANNDIFNQLCSVWLPLLNEVRNFIQGGIIVS